MLVACAIDLAFHLRTHLTNISALHSARSAILSSIRGYLAKFLLNSISVLVDLHTGKSLIGDMSFIQNFFKRHMPVVKAEEEEEPELVDPQKVLREACTKLPKCKSFQDKLNTCNDRVNSRTKTEETCLEELIDYVECVDHCAAKVLMSKLK